MTVKELIEKAQRNPSILHQKTDTKKKKRNRTRKKVDAPKQEYLYASQRQALERQGKLMPKEKESSKSNEFSPLEQARQLGLVNAAAQHADALIDTVEPKIMGQIRVGDKEGTSGSVAYILYKPAGWSILGSGGKKKAANQEKGDESVMQRDKQSDDSTKVNAVDDVAEDNAVDMNDILALLTPEEREEYEHVLSFLTPEEREEYMRELAGHDVNEDDDVVDDLEYDENDVLAVLSPDEHEEYEQGMGAVSCNDGGANSMNAIKKKGARIKRVKIEEEDGSTDILEYDENDLLVVMTPEEIEEFKAQGGFGNGFTADLLASKNAQKNEARSKGGSEKASFASPIRPSVVAWLKDLKEAEGTPIRGGKYWTAVAGATNVDDTGLVVICPKDKVDNVFVDYAKYVAVVGNGKYLAPKSKTKNVAIDKESIKMETISKLRKGRGDDIVLTVGITVVEMQSTCASLVQPCQTQFLDGIRGDPTANPLDRRASRRLLHCKALSVSSLVHDDTATVETDELPDDIAILAERRNKHEFLDGSFLGRGELRDNPLTTAYREINGAADGFEGWTVDRYDKWLFIQHDDKCYKGPLPSIHDGNTAGVYYLPSNPNRSLMGSRKDARPILSEGQAASDVVPILENGVMYHVSLDKDLSTGIFLDQRPQRAWLTQNCNKDTRVLNCFAHCGAFSVAAASAGASTVSLDLNKKWLDRTKPQIEANGIEYDDKHDCIYGDCKRSISPVMSVFTACSISC